VGGNVATAAKGVQSANTLAQGGTASQAAQQFGGTVGKVAKGAEFVQNRLAAQQTPAAVTAQAPQPEDELARIKKLASV
jgi:hypothetical protein